MDGLRGGTLRRETTTDSDSYISDKTTAIYELEAKETALDGHGYETNYSKDENNIDDSRPKDENDKNFSGSLFMSSTSMFTSSDDSTDSTTTLSDTDSFFTLAESDYQTDVNNLNSDSLHARNISFRESKADIDMEVERVTAMKEDMVNDEEDEDLSSQPKSSHTTNTAPTTTAGTILPPPPRAFPPSPAQDRPSYRIERFRGPVETCIIFDWDDTLFPSSWVDRIRLHANYQCLEELPEERRLQFVNLEQQIITLLEKASNYGHVLIITNAQNGWIQFCCNKFLPNLLHFFEFGPRYMDYISTSTDVTEKRLAKINCLQDSLNRGQEQNHIPPNRIHQEMYLRQLHYMSEGNAQNHPPAEPRTEVPPFIQLVSARANFEAIFPGDTVCWKAAAFAAELNLIQRHCNVHLRNILSLGDSLDERTAVKINANQINCKSKSVKFLDNPTHTQLLRELVVMVDYLPLITTDPNDMDVVLTVDANPNPNTESNENHQRDQHLEDNEQYGEGNPSLSPDEMTVVDN
jgi:hypothetical protein